MRIQTMIRWSVATVVALVYLSSTAAITSGEASGTAQTPRKQGKGAASPSIWTKETVIERPALPGQPRGRRRVIRAPLLTLEFRVLKQSEDGSAVEINPNAIFYTGDMLQLRIKPNQDGYLHIIEHTDGHDGEIIFPETRINNGQNFVKKNQEIIVPSNCEEIRKDNCWLQVQPPTGREIFTVIFSREASPAVMDQINRMGAGIKLDEITKIKESASKKTSRPNLAPERGGGAGRYVIWVSNADSRNNEELIARIVLNHQERSDGQ